jgi:hypothetical protein
VGRGAELTTVRIAPAVISGKLPANSPSEAECRTHSSEHWLDTAVAVSKPAWCGWRFRCGATTWSWCAASRALADPTREVQKRALLREGVGHVPIDLKALLAAAPMEGVDLERDRDLGRPVEL